MAKAGQILSSTAINCQFDHNLIARVFVISITCSFGTQYAVPEMVWVKTPHFILLLLSKHLRGVDQVKPPTKLNASKP
jgi:hypothetical protein